MQKQKKGKNKVGYIVLLAIIFVGVFLFGLKYFGKVNEIPSIAEVTTETV